MARRNSVWFWRNNKKKADDEILQVHHPRQESTYSNPSRTPLEMRLKGKLYYHDIWCNGDRRQPQGGSGCSCTFRNALQRYDSGKRFV